MKLNTYLCLVQRVRSNLPLHVFKKRYFLRYRLEVFRMISDGGDGRSGCGIPWFREMHFCRLSNSVTARVPERRLFHFCLSVFYRLTRIVGVCHHTTASVCPASPNLTETTVFHCYVRLVGLYPSSRSCGLKKKLNQCYLNDLPSHNSGSDLDSRRIFDVS